MKTRTKWLLTLVILLSVILSACGGNNNTGEEPDNNANENTSNVEDAGSDTGSDTDTEPTAYDLDAALTPFLAEMPGYNTIGLEALNTAMMESPPFIIDVRGASEAEEKGHIEGSILIPIRELAQNTDLLPSFDTPIVTYCGSGWRCTIATVALEALGWGDVTCLKGGSYGGWLAEGYAFVEGLQPEAEVLNAVEIDETALAFWDAVLTSIPDGYGGIKADAFNASLVENPDIFVIDARTAAEVEEKGLIEAENWVNIPVQDFLANTDLLPADPDTPIIVYCGSGHRSTQFMPMLWAYGYTDVLSLKSGFGGWVTAGFPVAEYAAP